MALFQQSGKPSVSEDLNTLSPSTFGTRFRSLLTSVAGSADGKTKWQGLRNTSIYKLIMRKNLISKMR